MATRNEPKVSSDHVVAHVNVAVPAPPVPPKNPLPKVLNPKLPAGGKAAEPEERAAPWIYTTLVPLPHVCVTAGVNERVAELAAATTGEVTVTMSVLDVIASVAPKMSVSPALNVPVSVVPTKVVVVVPTVVAPDVLRLPVTAIVGVGHGATFVAGIGFSGEMSKRLCPSTT
jgi:hypothetical protein